MVLSMSGRAKPTFIFMMANSPVDRQKTMSRITTRFGDGTSLLWTCGGLGSATLHEPMQSLINFGKFLVVMPRTASAHSGLMAQSRHFGAADLHMDMLWMVLNVRVTLSGLKRDGHSYVLLDTSTNDTLRLNQEFFGPLGMEHFYDSFALESQISVRREAMRLFGLREDELMPDLLGNTSYASYTL